MATKQIQLRGISRTPSDRLTNDGGCAESLNVQLDNTELAPSFYPDDVTTKRGLPADLEAEKIFIHKTANYENYIVVQSDKIVAYTHQIKSKESILIELTEIESSSDVEITSIGNTLVIYAEGKPHYLIFQNDSYRNLGNNVPFPTIELFDVRTQFEEKIYSRHIFDKAFPSLSLSYINNPPVTSNRQEAARGINNLFFLRESYTFNDPDYQKKIYLNDLLLDLSPHAWLDPPLFPDDHEEAIGEVKAAIKAEINAMINYNGERGFFSYPVWALYAVKLYDGSRIISCPQLISSGCDTPFDINLNSVIRPTESEKTDIGTVDICANSVYRLGVRMYDTAVFDNWEDVVESVEVYISDNINTVSFDKLTFSGYKEIPFSNSEITSVRVARLEGEMNAPLKEEALQHSVFVKVEEFKVKRDSKQSISLIEEDFVCDSKGYTKEEDRFSGRTLLSDTTYRLYDYTVLPQKTIVYNKSLLYVGAKKAYLPGPQWLLSQRYNTRLPWVLRSELLDSGIDISEFPDYYFLNREFSPNYEYSYQFAFLFDDGAVVHGASLGENNYSPSHRYKDLNPIVFDLIVYPSLNCAEAQWISMRDGDQPKLSSIRMQMHPTFPGLTYSFKGNELSSHEGDYLKGLPKPQFGEGRNSVYKSVVNNPFFIESVYEFDGEILGAAIATTTLSQGQFGQFPLYIFTEDGIWAMETAADGSFTSQKPLSREVCINPDSITSLDNGVVFVTAQGVMLMQGSQVTNISPFMNGKHYDVEESAKTIIHGQKDFKDFIPVVDDETHFMAFMREAKIAYDYAGRRLIFIKEGEDYQYIYKLDTQTWHKSAYGVKLIAPINSYPECLVMGEGEREKKYLKIISFAESQLDEQYLSDDFLSMFGDYYELTKGQLIEVFTGLEMLDITEWSDSHLTQMEGYLKTERVYYEIVPKSYITTKVLDLSTILDAAESKTPTKGVIATRPLDLGEPDVFKTITDIRVRGQYPKGAVKFILLGSNDGVTFYTINTLRGKAWKLFRIIILADLQPTDRISWIDVQYETKFTNKLR